MEFRRVLFRSDEETEIEDHEHEESEVEESTEHEAEEESHVEAEKASTASKQTAPSIDDIPLVITAEVGRIQMTVKKLVELQTGNLLELNVPPERSEESRIGKKRDRTCKL